MQLRCCRMIMAAGCTEKYPYSMPWLYNWNASDLHGGCTCVEKSRVPTNSILTLLWLSSNSQSNTGRTL